MAEHLLTVKEVAQHLKTSMAYVYKLHNCGLLKFMKIGRLKVRESTFNDFLEKWDGYDLTDPNSPVPVYVEENDYEEEI